MTARLVAMLDRPSEDSMGAVPVVIQGPGPELRVFGLARDRAGRFDKGDLAELIDRGQALELDIPVEEKCATGEVVAMWIGNKFQQRAAELQVPTPPLPASDLEAIQLPDGRAALGRPSDVHARLVAWLSKAFRRAVEQYSSPLARLMAQVFPDDELTRAALWHTAVEEDRDGELRWFTRLERDEGKSTTPAELERSFRELCKLMPPNTIRVIAVTGRAGSGHSEFAKGIAHKLHTEPLSFGNLLRERWKAKRTRRPFQRDLQQFGGQFLEDHGPFGFCRELLKTATNSTAECFVIDGVRHGVIKEALQFIFGDRVTFVGVDAGEERIFEELRGRSGPGSVEEIVADPTETEIPALIQESDERVPYPWAPADEQRVLAKSRQRA